MGEYLLLVKNVNLTLQGVPGGGIFGGIDCVEVGATRLSGRCLNLGFNIGLGLGGSRVGFGL